MITYELNFTDATVYIIFCLPSALKNIYNSKQIFMYRVSDTYQSVLDTKCLQFDYMMYVS